MFANCQSKNLKIVFLLQIFLPHMKKKSENQSPEDGEKLTDFWKVEDMFTFENVGFSNTVDNTKYLICADCEVGPIGCQKLDELNLMYVALDRVTHEDKDEDKD